MLKSPGTGKNNSASQVFQNRLIYILIFGLAILVHLTGLLNDVFISDSALYASIAKEMALSMNFMDLTFDGVDWLDKPHFQFWVTAVSFKIFGINVFAYKLPAILFTVLALVYTYKLSRELYNKDTALLAVLVLATAEHLVISNNDVRAEPYLTGLIITSIFYYHRLVREFRIGNLLLASLFGGLAIMTKGPFTLIPIAGAVGGELIIKRKWKTLFSWRWVFSLALIILFISPELYALYQQFDSHPEKMVFGQTGVSGIRFFLWESQFGRFFNTGPITGQGDPFFFLHTLLWAFLPWSVLMYFAIYKQIRDNLPTIKHEREFYTLSGVLLTLLVFSLSRFQLPHYTNVIFPLLAILTADFIIRANSKRDLRFINVTQSLILFLIFVSLFILQFLFKPEGGSLAGLTAFALTGLVLLLSIGFRIRGKTRAIFYSCLGIILLNFYLNLVFYPGLLVYQSGSRVAEFANTHYPGQEIRTLGVLSFTIHFHADARVRDRKPEDLKKELENSDFLVFTSETYLDSLKMKQVDYIVLEEFEHYHTTRVTGEFLNYRTRSDALRKHYLLRAAKSSEPGRQE